MNTDNDATSRYEILPFGAGEREALELSTPATITVTCSPKHGLDHSVAVAERIAASGHHVVLHLAARQVRAERHLDEVLGRMVAAGIDEAFVIGGDAHEPVGPYGSALEVLELITDHDQRPTRLGIGAYPEGHPLIETSALEQALTAKSGLADYIVTQLCFDTKLLVDWIRELRSAGVQRPIYVGIPGAVDRARLLEISVRVGVGASVSFLRKQRGLRRLFASPSHSAEKMYGALAPQIGDDDLNLAGFHWYTFNRLQATIDFERERHERLAPRSRPRAAAVR